MNKSDLEMAYARLEGGSVTQQEQAAYDVIAAFTTKKENQAILNEISFRNTAEFYTPQVSNSNWDEFAKESLISFSIRRKENQKLVLGIIAGIIGIGTAVATGGISVAAIAGLASSVKQILGIIDSDNKDEGVS